MAPKPRLQVDTSSRSPGFSPVATPVDTFRQTSKGRGLQQLAGALSGIAPDLAKYAQINQQISDEKTIAAAERQAAADIEKIQQAQKTFSEARKAGLIQEHQDPIFRARYQELVGRNLGESALAGWQLYKAENLSEAVTLEEYDQGFNDFYDKWTEENLGENRKEAALATAYRQTIQQGVVNDRHGWASQAGQRMSGRADEEFHSTIYRGVLNRARDGAANLTEYISAELEAHIGLQTDGSSTEMAPGIRRRINRSALEGAVNAAEALALTGDQAGALAVLNALQEVPTGPGGTLGSTSWGHDLVQEATSRIFTNLAAAETVEAREKNAALNEIVQTATDQVFTDPTASLSSVFRQLNNLGLDQQAAQATIRSLDATRNTILNAANESDPDVVRGIQLDIFRSPEAEKANIAAVTAALASRELSSGDAQNLYNLAKTYGSSTKAEGAFQDGAYDRMHGEFQRLFIGNTGILSGEDTLKRQQADAEYNRSWREWLDANPDADVSAKETFLLATSERLISRYDLYSVENKDIPRDPRLGPDPTWHQTPVMSRISFGLLDDIYNNGRALEDLPAWARGEVFTVFSDLGLSPADEETVKQLLSAQTPFFTTPQDSRASGANNQR